MSNISTEKYVEEAKHGIANPVLQKALFRLQDLFGRGMAEAYRRLPEGPDLRLKAHEIRESAIAHLDVLLEMLAAKIRANGGHVYFAETAKEAVDYCLAVAQRNDVRLVVKGTLPALVTPIKILGSPFSPIILLHTRSIGEHTISPAVTPFLDLSATTKLSPQDRLP